MQICACMCPHGNISPPAQYGFKNERICQSFVKPCIFDGSTQLKKNVGTMINLPANVHTLNVLQCCVKILLGP